MKRLTLMLVTAATLGLSAPAFAFPFDIPHLTYPHGSGCAAGASCRP